MSTLWFAKAPYLDLWVISPPIHSFLLPALLGSHTHFLMTLNSLQDKIFRRKRLSTGANFVHVHIEIWDKSILKFKKNSMYQEKSNNNVILKLSQPRAIIIGFCK